ncbi:MAG: hypothetical protein JXA67_11270, partial [Micromonosporaceae bacterium]|nr:hypothetical protein [Micromonosporaceae bacterium]
MIDHRSTAVRWLTRPRRTGVTWGVPWPRGTVAAGEDFELLAGTGGTSTSPGGAAAVRVQSWVTATWPDGSVKWSAHALGPKDTVAEAYTLVPGLTSGEGPGSVPEVRIAAGQHEVVVDTGVVEWVVPRSGAILVRSARREDREIVRDVRLVSLWQDQPALDGAGSVDRWELRGDIATVTVEQSGPVRAVVRVDGRHMPVVPHGAAGSAPGGAAGSAPGGAAGSAPGGAAGS